MDINNLGDRIKRIRKGLGLNQLEFAEKIGLESAMAISKYENNTRTPDKGRLIKISELGRISLDELLTGEDQKKKQESLPDAAQEEYFTIPQFSDRISAGGGLIPANEIEIKVSFRKDWLRKKGDHRNMSLIRVSGDSMEPTLTSNDLVLINHGQNYLDPQGGIYAIALDDCIMIKRLQIIYPVGMVKIISDNNKYESFTLPQEQIKINGRVIWFGREI